MNTETKAMRKRMNQMLSEIANGAEERLIHIASDEGCKTISYVDFKTQSREKIIKNEYARLPKLAKSDIANLTALVGTGMGQQNFDRELI